MLIAAAKEGCELADEIGDRGYSRGCRWCLGTAHWVLGDIAVAEAQFRELTTEADGAHALIWQVNARSLLCHVLAHSGRADEGRALALEALDGAAEIGLYQEGVVYAALAVAELAGGGVDAARDASEAARDRLVGMLPRLATTTVKSWAQVALARGDLTAARRFADEDVSAAAGWFMVQALATRARVALAENETGQAERDAHDALTRAAEMRAHLFVPDLLECLGGLAHGAGNHLEAVRLFAAAHMIRQRTGIVRFSDIRGTTRGIGGNNPQSAERRTIRPGVERRHGAVHRRSHRLRPGGRGERKRPSTGWASMTPTEHDVVRLVSEGLGNKDIGSRLFISPRTVQTHLTHVYAKLGLTSRMQLVQEAARRG